MVVVAGEHADVLAVAVAAVQGGDARKPAIHKPPAPGRAEDDTPVRAVDRFDVVVRPVGQLHQSAAVGVDFVQVVRMLSAFSVGEQNLLRVVVHLRIAHSALWIIQQHCHLAGVKIQAAQASAVPVAPRHAVLFLEGVAFPVAGMDGVIAERDVPMGVLSPRADRKDNLVQARHRALEERLQHRARAVCGLRLALRPGLRYWFTCRRRQGTERQYQQRRPGNCGPARRRRLLGGHVHGGNLLLILASEGGIEGGMEPSRFDGTYCTATSLKIHYAQWR